MNSQRVISRLLNLVFDWLKQAAKWPDSVFNWIATTFRRQQQPASEEIDDWVDDGPAPVVTQQPTVGGDAGQPLEIVVSEVVSDENDEIGMFTGLGAFLRTEKPRDYTVADGVLQKLVTELKNKAVHLGADAVVSTTIKLVRGVDDSGQRRLKMSAIGTAIRLKGTNS
ncbi:MAG: hypothetical protein AAGA00_08735 [Pseudomonadota bacterium]